MKISSGLWPWIIATAIIGLALYSIGNILLPFITGSFIAYAMHPTVTKLEQLGIRRTLATLAMILGLFIVIGTMLFVLIPFIVKELLYLAAALPEYTKSMLDILMPYLDKISPYIEMAKNEDIQSKSTAYVGSMLSWALKFMANLLTNTLAIANLILLIVITPMVAFYMLRDWPIALDKIRSFLPKQQAATILDLAEKVNNTLGEYVRGQSLVCLMLAALYSTGFLLIGLEYAFTIGIVTGLLSFIPYVGMLIGFVAAMGISISQFTTWEPIAMVGVVFAVGNFVEGQLLSPNLVGGRIGLHPVWVIFALLAGGSLMGFIGMLLALPTAAILGVLVRYAMSQYLSSTLYLGESKTTPSKKKA